MATPPTLVASYGNATIGSSTKTASVTVQAGDLIVVKAGTNNSGARISSVSGGGLTYTLQQSIVGVTQQSCAYVWTAVSPSSQTFTLTVTPSSAFFTFAAEVWRNHNGIGSSGKKTATSTTSLSLTTQGANSAITVLNADWNAVNGSTRTYLTSAGAFTENGYQTDPSWLTFYSGYHADAGAVGSKTVGMSAPSGQRPSLIVLEVLAAPPSVTGALTITATALPTNAPPAVRVDVNDTRSPGQASLLTIVRNNPDGTQSPVRTSDGNPLPLTGGIGLVYDYEMPLGEAVSYTALEVPTVASLQVTVASTQAWLVHPGVPSLSIVVDFRVGTNDEETWATTRGVFWPLGRATPVVVTDGARKAAASRGIFSISSAAELEDFRALVADAAVLLLNVPASVPVGLGSTYISLGDISVKRPSSIGSDQLRDIEASYQVVNRPAGGTQSARTWADVLASYGSWAAVLAAYRSWADVLTGP